MVKNTHFLILTEKHWINASKILFIYFYQIIWSKLSNEKKKYKNKKNCLEIINFNIFFIIGLKIDCNSNWVSGQNFPPRSMKFFYKKLELFFYKILFSELIYDESKSNGNVFFRVIWCETPCIWPSCILPNLTQLWASNGSTLPIARIYVYLAMLLSIFSF